MAKRKSHDKLLIDYIKSNQLYSCIMIDRIIMDAKSLKDELPNYRNYCELKEKEGKFVIFTPEFFEAYVKSIEIFEAQLDN